MYSFTIHATIPFLIDLQVISSFIISKYAVINIFICAPLYILVFLFQEGKVLKVGIVPNLWIVKSP